MSGTDYPGQPTPSETGKPAQDRLDGPASSAGGPPNSAAGIKAVPGTAGQGSGPVRAAKARIGDRRGSGGGKRRKNRAEEPMVPDATFTSYYGRPVVKASPWENDIPAYLFFGGLAAGSSLLSAGADLSDRPALRRAGRLAALGALSISMLALVRDLGKPERFLNMLRVMKPTSPMSVGTWILTAYGPGAAVAGAAEIAKLLPVEFGLLGRLLQWAARPAGIAAAGIAPGVAAYTAVLLTDTATPAWHDAHRELPFVFVSSASAASGGFGMLAAPLHESGPARRLAVAGAVAELAIEHRMEQSMGLSAEALHHGTPGKLMAASKALTAAGAVGAVLFGGRSRVGAAASGLALMAGSACTRFGVFEAGQESARDPRYTVVPQRERVEKRRAEARQAAGSGSATEEQAGQAAEVASEAVDTAGPDARNAETP